MCSGKYPCGKCASCLEKKRNAWSIRAQHHSAAAAHVFFGLLTYSDDNLFKVVDLDTGELNYSLRYRDVQLCFKRMRKNYAFLNFSYMVSGEYSPKKERPHWHLLFFVNSVSLDNDYQIRSFRRHRQSWRGTLKHFRRVAQQLNYLSLFNVSPIDFTHNYLMHSWKKGFAPLEFPKGINKCVHYATKYMYSKLQHYSKVLEAPSFHVSNGLGSAWLTEDNVYRIISPLLNGCLSICEPNSQIDLIFFDVEDAPFSVGRELRSVHYDYIERATIGNKITMFGGQYSLPRYYRKKIYDILPPFVADEIKHINSDYFEYSYWRRIYDWMLVKGYTDFHVTGDRLREYRDYCFERDRLKKEHVIKYVNTDF